MAEKLKKLNKRSRPGSQHILWFLPLYAMGFLRICGKCNSLKLLGSTVGLFYLPGLLIECRSQAFYKVGKYGILLSLDNFIMYLKPPWTMRKGGDKYKCVGNLQFTVLNKWALYNCKWIISCPFCNGYPVQAAATRRDLTLNSSEWETYCKVTTLKLFNFFSII